MKNSFRPTLVAFFVGRFMQQQSDPGGPWRVGKLLCVPAFALLLAGSLAAHAADVHTVVRNGQSLTLLPDGHILLAGGFDDARVPTTNLALADSAGNLKPLPAKMQYARSGHTATVLPNGQILIFGGYGSDGAIVSAAEILDPVTWQLVPISNFRLLPRAFHTATVLTDGTLVVIGGVGVGGELKDDVQIWDYRTGNTLAYHAVLSVPRQRQTAVLMPNGNVQISGGLDRLGRQTDVSEEFDTNSRRFSLASSTASPSEEPAVAETLPTDGQNDVRITDILAVRFETMMSVSSLNASQIVLQDSSKNPVQVKVTGAESGRLVFVVPNAPLKFGTSYVLTLDGVFDTNKRQLPTRTIDFTTQKDPSDSSDEQWIPGADAFNGQWSSRTGTSEWQKLPALQAPPGVTALAGQVLRLNGLPLAHVLLEVNGIRALTDSTGRFLISNLREGHQVLLIDGTKANRGDVEYGIYEAGVDIKLAKTNVLNYTIWMTKLDTGHAIRIPSPTMAADTVVTTPLLPGLEFHIPQNAVITDRDGHPVRRLTITPIPLDKPPFPLPPGVQVPIYFTIQPGAAYIRVTSAGSGPKGAQLIYPNTFHLAPGTEFNFWNYDADSKGWYVYGHGKVNIAGTSVVPDPGVVIYELTGAMAGNAPGKNPFSPVPPPKDGDPVQLNSGQFVYNKTDLLLPDVMPVSLTRTYCANDSVSWAFGIGTTDNYDVYLTGDTNPYTFMELIQPDGYRVRFNRVSAGTSFIDALYSHTEAQDDYYGATIIWNGNGWTLTRKDGTQLTFPDSNSNPFPLRAALLAITDRYGNSVTLQRDGSGNLQQATSLNGRYIKFTYDNSNRVIQATDNIGRSVHYTYDTSGRLQTVQDAGGGSTSFTYNSQNQMLTVQDARGITYLTNQYDSAGRVSQQTLANQGTYLFAWTPTQNTAETFGSGGSTSPTSGGVLNFRNCSDCFEGYMPLVAQVDVTDPRGYVRRVIFDTMGRVSSDIHALGQPEQQTVTFQYNADNTLKSSTNPLLHQTNYTYDANLNLTEIDRLAETGTPISTLFAYEGTFNRLTSMTDPLGHTTTFTVVYPGNTSQVTDPLGNSTSLTYNADGTPATITDALGNSIQLGYSSGDFVSIRDPLGNQTTRFVDSVGRLVAVTDPAGHQTKYQYDGLNQVTQLTDPVGKQTTFAYDPNGNLLSVTDALNHTTSYTYNNMDLVATRTDPLTRQESYTYDLGDNLLTFTDRKGQVTKYTYDGLNRATLAGFGAQTNGGTTTYVSTIAYQYDAGSRMTQAVDSISGTVTRGYDGLNRLTTETTPQGSISYGYDNAGRRTSMHVAGQTQVGYTYDNANRLTQIAQGSSTVGFTFDNGNRRSTLTLPNGIVATYGYDQDSRVTGISYALTGNSVGNLTYTYDSSGRRVSAGGSLASSGFPFAVTGAAYDAANQLTNWNGATISYDANGNMLSDGVHIFAWDARNQLGTIDSGSTASFGYDPFGRRASKTVLGTATGFFYDGANPVQELSGTTPTANLLTGGIDEYFTRIDANGARSFLTDALGSTLSLADSTGTVQTQYGYDPFGNTTQSGVSTSNSYAYTGRENDSTGLYYYRARYYSPPVGHFVSEDPIRFQGGDINLYRYARGNPISLRDPSGRATANLGGSLTCSFPGWNATYSGGIVVDSKGNVGAYNSGGGGASVGGGCFFGLNGGGSDADTICGFAGPFVEYSGNGGLGAGGGASVYTGGGTTGWSLSGGTAAGAEATIDITYTKVTPFAGRKSWCPSSLPPISLPEPGPVREDWPTMDPNPEDPTFPLSPIG